jgi:amino-acid N-acetyltransferase
MKKTFKNTTPLNQDISMDYKKLVSWFRQAAPYINTHKDRTFVVTLCSEATIHKNIDTILHDIALLNTLGARIIIVHGISFHLQKKIIDNNLNNVFVNEKRVIDKKIIRSAIECASIIRSNIETKLSTSLANTGLYKSKIKIASANVITAKPVGVIEGVDMLFTGKVRKIETESIIRLLDLGNIVLLSPLGLSPSGETFNIPHEEVGSEIAISLAADKLINFTDQDGLLSIDNKLIKEISSESAAKEIINYPIKSFKRFIKEAINAVNMGVPRAHLMSFKHDGALLQELYTIDGIGTLILKNDFEKIRDANKNDISAISDMITPLEIDGILVTRDHEKFSNELDYFSVIERENIIVAVGALYIFQDDKRRIGEIACITTHKNYRNNNRGMKLLTYLEKKAVSNNLDYIFILTTQTADWFIDQGYIPGEVDQLPSEKKSLYNYQRNSKIYIKKIK